MVSQSIIIIMVKIIIHTYVLGCKIWEENFAALLSLVKEFIVDVWDVRKILFGSSAHTCGYVVDGSVVRIAY